MATLLWSGNFPRGNQRESRNHLCVQSSLLQRNYPVQTPTSLRAQVPWPSPHTTCKAFQFAAHFVLDIKVERAQASENDMSHDVLGKNKLSQAKEGPHPQNPTPPCTSLVKSISKRASMSVKHKKVNKSSSFYLKWNTEQKLFPHLLVESLHTARLLLWLHRLPADLLFFTIIIWENNTLFPNIVIFSLCVVWL